MDDDGGPVGGDVEVVDDVDVVVVEAGAEAGADPGGAAAEDHGDGVVGVGDGVAAGLGGPLAVEEGDDAIQGLAHVEVGAELDFPGAGRGVLEDLGEADGVDAGEDGDAAGDVDAFDGHGGEDQFIAGGVEGCLLGGGEVLGRAVEEEASTAVIEVVTAVADRAVELDVPDGAGVAGEDVGEADGLGERGEGGEAEGRERHSEEGVDHTNPRERVVGRWGLDDYSGVGSFCAGGENVAFCCAVPPCCAVGGGVHRGDTEGGGRWVRFARCAWGGGFGQVVAGFGGLGGTTEDAEDQRSFFEMKWRAGAVLAGLGEGVGGCCAWGLYL